MNQSELNNTEYKKDELVVEHDIQIMRYKSILEALENENEMLRGRIEYLVADNSCFNGRFMRTCYKFHKIMKPIAVKIASPFRKNIGVKK